MENNFFLQEDQLQKTSNSIDSAGEKNYNKKPQPSFKSLKPKHKMRSN